MKSIQVTSLPLKEVIADIALSFDTSYKENCEEYTVKLPAAIGKGEIRGINFEGGLGIIQYDCIFKQDMEIQFIVNAIHPLKFLYILEGSLNHRFANEKESHPLQQYQHSIVASYGNNGHILTFKANEHTCINSLEIDRDLFRSKMSCELKGTSKELSNLFKDRQASISFYYKGNYSLEISELFKDMKSFLGEGFIRKIYLEGISYLMLTKEMAQYQDSLKDEGKRNIIPRIQVKQIEAAAKIIESEIAVSITVGSLARRTGLNVNKLQNGFQNMYKSTVNEYVQKKRLELSKKMLINTDYSIGEIVDKVGLSSKSYFSKLFKNNYNLTPSQFRNYYRRTSFNSTDETNS